MTDYLKTFTEGEKIKASDTNSNNQYILSQITSSVTLLEAEINNKADKDFALPVGAILPYSKNTPPTGWLICDGSAISRTSYANLFYVIGTSYGEGDGTNTFNLPNYIGKFPEGATSVGTYKDAGLPNITGNTWQIEYYGSNSAGTNGAFSVNSYDGIIGAGTQYAGYTQTHTNINFSASRSNAIYGKSNTVQPASLTTLFIIKY